MFQKVSCNLIRLLSPNFDIYLYKARLLITRLSFDAQALKFWWTLFGFDSRFVLAATKVQTSCLDKLCCWIGMQIKGAKIALMFPLVRCSPA